MIAANSLSNTATFTAQPDDIDEPNETIIVDITSVTNALESGTQQVTITITDDDSSSLAIDDVSGAEDSGSLTFTVSLTGQTASGFTVDVATADLPDQAVAGTDYTATSTTLTFSGSLNETQTVNVPLTADTMTEPDETFAVNLSNLQGNAPLPTLTDAQGIGMLQNDDGADLSLTKTVTPIRLTIGDEATFTVTVTNKASRATGITVSDVLPAGFRLISHTAAQGTYDTLTGVWTIDELAGLATTTLTLTVQVTPQATDPMGTGAFKDVFADDGGLTVPLGLVFGPDGHLYVSSEDTAQVLRYNGTTGAFIDVFASGGGLTQPRGLVFGPDSHLYVSSSGSSQILRYDGTTGAFLDVIATLSHPTGLVFGPEGHLNVSSGTTDQILRYNGTTGAFLDVFVSGGGLDFPTGLVFGPDGHLYVSSGATDQILRYNGTTGAFLDDFASGGGLDLPTGLVFGPDGHLYVSGEGSGVMRYHGTTGAFLGVFAPVGPQGLVFGPDGHLYVSSTGDGGVFRFDGFLTNHAHLTSVTPSDTNQTNNWAAAGIDYTKPDFGDAPDGTTTPQYPTLLSNNGARHGGTGIIRLGSLWDAEIDGQPDATASGDNVSDSADEDGVIFPATGLLDGQIQSVTVTGTAGNLLNAWIDFNQDGDWLDAGEQIATNVATTGAAQSVSFMVPAGATLGTTFARFRIDSGGGLLPTGLAADGEVEDYPVVLIGVADLHISKTDGATSAVPGTALIYTLVAANAGPSAATGVTVTDTFPALLTCSWTSVATGGATGNTASSGNLVDTLTLPATSAVTYTATCGIDPSATGTLSNTAMISSSVIDLVPGNNSATDADTVLVPQADLALTKTGSTNVVAGTNVVYTLSVTNNGPSDAQSVQVADPTPTGLTFVSNTGDCATTFPCSLGTVTNGASKTITTTFSVPSGYTTPDPMVNIATVSSATADPSSGNNSATANTSLGLASADLAITKTGPTNVVAGTNVVYTLSVTNNGPSDAQSVQVTDPTPTGLTFVSTIGDCTTTFPCSLGTIVNGTTATITATFHVPSNYTTPDPIVNTATVSTSTPDPNPANNSATAQTTLSATSSDLALSVALASPATAGTPTQSVQKIAEPGTQLSYVLTITNNGPSDAPDVSVTATTPSGLNFVSTSGVCTTVFPCALGTIPAGQTQTITATYQIPSDFTGPSPIVFRASVSSTSADVTTTNNTAVLSLPLGGTLADLHLTKTGPSGVITGTTVVYTLTVTNLGPSDAQTVSVTDPTPATLSFVSNSGDCTTAFPCSLATVPAGQSRTITSTFAVPLTYFGPNPIVNTATVTTATTDLTSTNNTATAQTAVNPPILHVTPNGLGDLLLFPYWTTEERETLLAIGSAFGGVARRFVHVRVREGVTSQDVLDFTICLSPGDIWTAALTTDPNGDSVLRVGNPGSCDDAVASAIFTAPPVSGQAVPLSASMGYLEAFSMAPTGGADVLWGIATPINPSVGVASSYLATTLTGFQAVNEGSQTTTDLRLAEALARTGGIDKEVLLLRYVADQQFGASTQLVLTFPAGRQPGVNDPVSVFAYDEEEQVTFSPRAIRLPDEVNVCTLDQTPDRTTLSCPGSDNTLAIRGPGGPFTGGWLRILNTTRGAELDGQDALPVTRFPVLGLVFSTFGGSVADFDQTFPISWVAVTGAGGFGGVNAFSVTTPRFAPWVVPGPPATLLMPGDNVTGGLPLTDPKQPVLP